MLAALPRAPKARLLRCGPSGRSLGLGFIGLVLQFLGLFFSRLGLSGFGGLGIL
ncbi:MAG: hypothetical protein IPJ36_02975 [Simplicispira sp.]|nr:hypothetical protein [Simplicispira sp.]